MFRKTILVTGGSGFIGQHLKNKLVDKFDVVNYDIAVRPNFDLFSPLLEEYIKKVDVVIHLAAKVSVNESFTNPVDVFRVNVLGTARVVELCLKHNKKLIFPSSAAVYHKDLSPYAYTKYLAEEIVKGVMEKLPVVIFRFYNVYGKKMNKNSGSIMFNFLKDKKITVFGDGEQTRDFINVEDIVSIVADAVKNKRYNGQIIDIGTGKAYSINYVAGLFAHYRKKKIIYMPTRREIKWSIADISKLKTFYKQPLVTNLQKDIKNLCKYEA